MLCFRLPWSNWLGGAQRVWRSVLMYVLCVDSYLCRGVEEAVVVLDRKSEGKYQSVSHYVTWAP